MPESTLPTKSSRVHLRGGSLLTSVGSAWTPGSASWFSDCGGCIPSSYGPCATALPPPPASLLRLLDTSARTPAHLWPHNLLPSPRAASRGPHLRSRLPARLPASALQAALLPDLPPLIPALRFHPAPSPSLKRSLTSTCPVRETDHPVADPILGTGPSLGPRSRSRRTNLLHPCIGRVQSFPGYLSCIG